MAIDELKRKVKAIISGAISVLESWVPQVDQIETWQEAAHGLAELASVVMVSARKLASYAGVSARKHKREEEKDAATV